MIRRVNFYAGPGSGKSTLAARIFAELSAKKYKVAHVTEFVKDWAILGITPQGEDQDLIFASQKSCEDRLLRKADLIVTDSPVLMNTAYSKFYGYHGSEELISLARKWDRKVTPLNFFIERTVPYEQFGRYQNYDKAVEFDNFLLDFLSQNLEGELHHVTVLDLEFIIDLIESQVRQGGPHGSTDS